MNATIQQVRIHVDRKPLESPHPTSGDALYLLGHVHADHDLFREVAGDQEDELIRKGQEAIHLKQDEHFYSAERDHKEFTIIANARQKVVQKRKLSFDKVVALAFDKPPTGENILFTVTYRHGPPTNPEGTLVAGQTVKIKNGMIFNVTATNKS